MNVRAFPWGLMFLTLLQKDPPVILSPSPNRNIDKCPFRSFLFAFEKICLMLTRLVFFENLQGLSQRACRLRYLMVRLSLSRRCPVFWRTWPNFGRCILLLFIWSHVMLNVNNHWWMSTNTYTRYISVIWKSLFEQSSVTFDIPKNTY